MALLLIVGLILALYIQTLGYNYVIDDNVKRNGYMYEVPLTTPSQEMFNSKPSRWYRLFMIGMHCVNTTVIYLIWGWCPALLFAVHPMGVWGTAWVTGNYYATTTYFCLISYYILHTFPNVFGSVASSIIFTAALNSTVNALTFPFVFLLTGQWWGCALFFPLIMYLKGKRFTTGLKIRLDFNKDKPVKAKFTWRRIAVMTKVVARYIHLCMFPLKTGFFRSFGKYVHERQENYDAIHKFNREFWSSLALCLTLFICGLFIHPVGTLWFFIMITLHSQWNLTGQFFADRYAYLPIIGLCVVFGTVLQNFPFLATVIVTALVIRTLMFIPVWRNQEHVWENDVQMFPEYSHTWNNASQYFMNNAKAKKDDKVPIWKMNKLAYYMFKALYMDGTSWEIFMNFACFQVISGQIESALASTRKAIELLRPIAGGSGQFALNKLTEQEKMLDGKVREMKEKQEKARQEFIKNQQQVVNV